MYAGKVKNSSLKGGLTEYQRSHYGDTHETPTGAAESWPLELDGGDDGTVKLRVAAATPHVKRDETRTE